MGWFKSLFKKEEELQRVYVDIDELEPWFISKSDIRIENIKESIKEDMDKISQLIEQIKTSSKVLEEARLRNDKMPERVIHIMEGNRKSYLTAINNLMGRIQPPSTINFSSVSEYVSQFEDSITSFAKMSSKSYHILQEFFAHESGEIAQRIKEIDLTVRGMLDNEYKRINGMMENINRINDMMKKKETAEIMLEDHRKESAGLRAEIEASKANIESLKKTKDYRFYLETEKTKDQLKAQMKDVEKRVFEMFAPLDRPLRKFAKISAENEKLIDAYSEEPMNALLADSDLKILPLLERMKSLIERNEIELKDKAKEKAIANINAIIIMVLRDSVAEYSTLRETYDERERSMKLNTAVHAQNEYEYKISHLKDKLAKIEANKEKLERFLELPGLDSALESAKKDILEMFNTEIVIRFDGVTGKKAEKAR